MRKTFKYTLDERVSVFIRKGRQILNTCARYEYVSRFYQWDFRKQSKYLMMHHTLYRITKKYMHRYERKIRTCSKYVRPRTLGISWQFCIPRMISIGSCYFPLTMLDRIATNISNLVLNLVKSLYREHSTVKYVDHMYFTCTRNYAPVLF